MLNGLKTINKNQRLTFINKLGINIYFAIDQVTYLNNTQQ